MNSPNNTQTQPINPLVVVQRQRQALRQHTKDKKLVKDFRGLIKKQLDITQVHADSYEVANYPKDKGFDVWRQLVKETIKYLTYIINRNKVETIKSYKKCQELCNSFLEYAIENMTEGTMLSIANGCKNKHILNKEYFKSVIIIDRKVGYWK